MSVKDHVQMGLKKSEFGIDGYFLPKTSGLDHCLNSMIWPGQKKTYIDDAVKEKSFVPPAKYEVRGSLADKSTKSGMDKEPRRTPAMQVAATARKNNFPNPHTYKPDEKHTRKNHKACLSFKGDRTNFISDAQFRGAMSPQYHRKNHELTESRVMTPKYKAPGKADLAGPAFLRQTVASKLISPVTYKATESYKSTQLNKPRFYSNKQKGGSLIDQAVKKSKNTPGAGTYDLKQIDKGYQMTTRGASRGWK